MSERDSLVGLRRTVGEAKKSGLDPYVPSPRSLLQFHHQWSISGVWPVKETVDVHLVERIDPVAQNREVGVFHDTLETIT